MKLPSYNNVHQSTKIQHIISTNDHTTNTNWFMSQHNTLNMKMLAQREFQRLETNLLINSPPHVVQPDDQTKLRDMWMDYHGIGNWDGLLDPLDEALRHEIVRYGQFVEATYRSCDYDPSSPSYATCRYPRNELLDQSGLTKSGYRVTKNLTATSGIKVPKWVERGPSWVGMQSSWIGYVAVCQDRREISRLGRRDVVIALRGTITCLEWLENLRATLTHLPGSDLDYDSDPDSTPMVESGFLSLFTSSFQNRSSLQDQLRDEIQRILKKYENEPLSLTITGHSLGAALATLAAYDIKQTFKNAPLVTVLSFAGPRVGNSSFRRKLDEQGAKVLRIVNSDDVITKVPGFVVESNEHMQFTGSTYTAAVALANIIGWLQRLVYADVGCELRMSSRGSPDLDRHGIATCHDLQTYLHLVNGLDRAHYCPFRATARKMMAKALMYN